MPVLREERRYATEGDRSRVGQAASMAGPWTQLARETGQLASQMGRLMGQLAQDEATAIAQSVEIDESHNVVWRGGEDQRRTMGVMAGRAFDATLNRRMAARVAAQAQGAVQDAHNRNFDDPAGFESDAAAALDGMRGAIPEQYAGFFEDAALEMMGRYGGQVGYRAAQRDRAVAADDWSVAAQMAFEAASSRALAGNQQGALGVLHETAQLGADLVERGVIRESDRRLFIANTQAAIGVGQLHARGRDEEWSAADYEAARQGLLSGDPEWTAGFPSRESQLAAARQLGPRVTALRQQEAEAQRAASMIGEISSVMQGGAENTKGNRELLDSALAQGLGENSPLTPEHWLSGAVNQQGVWDAMQAAGMPAESLVTAFRMVARGRVNPEQAAVVHAMWTELANGTSPDGGPFSLIDALPDEAASVLSLMDAYLQGGGMTPETAYEQARAVAGAPLDVEIFAGRLRESGLDGFDSLTEPNAARQAWRGAVRTALSGRLDAVVDTPALNRAVAVSELLVASGEVSPEDALDMVSAQAEAAMPETDFLWEGAGRGRVSRSAFAPEKHYAVQGSMDWFTRWAAREVATRMDLTDWPGDLREDGTPVRMRPGEDFMLEPDRRSAGRPRYFVMVDPDGDGIPQPALDANGQRLVLDPGPAAREATRYDDAVDRVRAGESREDVRRVREASPWEQFGAAGAGLLGRRPYGEVELEEEGEAETAPADPMTYGPQLPPVEAGLNPLPAIKVAWEAASEVAGRASETVGAALSSAWEGTRNAGRLAAEQASSAIALLRDPNTSLTPSNAVVFLRHWFTGSDVTEAMLSPSDRRAVAAAVERAVAAGRDWIDYEDWGVASGQDVIQRTAQAGFTASFTDPAYRMATLIGGAMIERGEDGTITLVDRYDFNPGPLGRRAKALVDEGDWRGLADMLGELAFVEAVRVVAFVTQPDRSDDENRVRIRVGAPAAAAASSTTPRYPLLP